MKTAKMHDHATASRRAFIARQQAQQSQSNPDALVGMAAAVALVFFIAQALVQS